MARGCWWVILFTISFILAIALVIVVMVLLGSTVPPANGGV